MVVCVVRCNLPPALLAECLETFTCHCGNTGVERTPNKSQHTKLILEKKILPPLLPGFELTTFQSQVWSSYQQAIPTKVLNVSKNVTVLVGADGYSYQLSTGVVQRQRDNQDITLQVTQHQSNK